MRRKIENNILVNVEGVDLTTVSNIEFYVKQPALFLEYIPRVISAGQMIVKIPYEDAMKLKLGGVSLQFAYTDASGTPNATDTIIASVKELLKEDGYDTV